MVNVQSNQSIWPLCHNVRLHSCGRLCGHARAERKRVRWRKAFSARCMPAMTPPRHVGATCRPGPVVDQIRWRAQKRVPRIRSLRHESRVWGQSGASATETLGANNPTTENVSRFEWCVVGKACKSRDAACGVSAPTTNNRTPHPELMRGGRWSRSSLVVSIGPGRMGMLK